MNGYQRYLVRWQGRPESKDSWITREDLQCIDPDLLEEYQSQTNPYSMGLSSSHPRRNGGDTKTKTKPQEPI
ncbi:chromo domain-containing protein [Areca yellow leaf disease phytoplasma]|uniref:chromo domain-containing protein n=1 Tax=Areca yellow leaf disease phytoplasma TaxID=927614 RepID=UPI0035B522C4